MVNYYANSTEVLGDNYSIISLECDEYNPNIDGTVTLTVTAKSVYGNPIEDMEIPVTASEGNFTELNGSSITAASTVTGTTDSNGEFTLTYACSEWGLITFSANNVSLQIKVKGFKSKSMWNGTLYYDNEKVEYWLNYAPSSTTLQVHNSWTDSGAFDVVPEELRPKMFVFSTTSDTRLTVRVHPDTGKLQYVNSVQMTDPIYKCILTWFLP